MFNKPAKLAVFILILLVLSLSVVSAEARTFRKAVSQESTDLGAQISNNEQQTTNYKPQTAQDLQNCEPTIKKIRGKRVVTNNCEPQIFDFAKDNFSKSQQDYIPYWLTKENLLNNPKLLASTSDDKIPVIIELKEKPLGPISSSIGEKYAPQLNSPPTDLRQVDKLNDQIKKEIYVKLELVLNESHENLKNAVQSCKGNFKGHTVIVNAVFADIPKKCLATLSKNTNILAIYEDKKQQVDLVISMPTTGAPTWHSNGYTGGIWDFAVIDSGVDTTHPALTTHPHIDQVFHDTARNAAGYNDNPNSVDDLQGHGTHVAGIIASADSTDRGVAFGADTLINAKACYRDSAGGSWCFDSDNMQAIDWAVQQGADVVSRSTGICNVGQTDCAIARYLDWVTDSLGVLVINSAGNEGPNAGTVTGIAYNVISVGASDDRDTISRTDDAMAGFSSRGPTADNRRKPDMVAPGRWIRSTNFDWETQTDFITMSGTSMAAPHVSGAVLLLLNHIGVNPMRLKAALLNYAENRGVAGWNNDWGWGYLDLDRTYNKITYNAYAGNVLQDSYRLYRPTQPSLDEQRATLVWNRHMPSRTGAAYNLNNLDLSLFRESTNALLAASTSTVDNVEQVIFPPAIADTVIKVKAFGSFSHGSNNENYALAVDRPYTLANGPLLSVAQGMPSTSSTLTFMVSTTVTNNGDLTAHGVSATLNLPAGLSIINGPNPQNVGAIASGSSATATWTVQAASSGTYSGIYTSVISNSYGEQFTAASSQGSITISLDTTKPTVSVSANPNPVGVGQTVTYTANANDDNLVSKIEISVDGVFVNTCYPNQPSFSCSWSTSYPATGTHSFYANAFDNSGQSASTTIQTLQVVDASMPSISISASPNPVGVGQTVTFTATASDDIQVAIIRLIVDGGTFRECLINAPTGSCSEVSSYGATGTHTYRGFARDSSGNEVSTPDYTLTVQQQPAPGPNPVAKISVNKNPVYTGETFTFTVTAQDDVQINTVWVYVEPDGSDALQLQNTCPGSGASGSCSWTSSFNTAKQHKFQGCTVDNENRFDCDPDSGWYLLDVITPPPPPSPPTVSVSASPSPVNVGQTITITANANDNVQVANIKIIVDGIEVKVCPVGAASGSCAYPASYASIGTHTYYATAADNEGSVGRDPASGTKGFNVVDTTAPTISASATPNPVDVGQLITLNATVSDNLKVAWAAIYIDGLLARNCTISKQSGWCSHTPSYPATGAHTYYALAADISSNRAQTPTQNFNVVDSTNPTITVLASPNPVPVGQTIIVTANATDNAKVNSIAIFIDGTEAQNCTISAISGSCSKLVSYLNIGTHTYYAQTADSSGNYARDPGTGTKSFDVVDGIGPVIQPLVINTADMTATISASASDNLQLSEIKVFVDGAAVKTCPLALANGTCVYTNTWAVSGMHTAYAIATDNAGNTATAPTKSFTVGKPGVIVLLQGQGWVTTSSEDIKCGFIFNDCAKNYTNFGDKITLTATPSPSPLYVFDGWDGSCSGTSKTCTVTMNSTEKVYASFSPAKIPQFYELNVSVIGSGTGKVVSTPTGISCTSGLCSTLFKKGTTVTLTATPNGGSTFAGWSGVCSGTAATCAVSMSASKSVAATFS